MISIPTPEESSKLILNAAVNIFELNRLKHWNDIKSRITEDRIRLFYETIFSIRHPHLIGIHSVPEPTPKLRGLYLGDIEPTDIVRSILRFSLYVDQIVLIDPFQNPGFVTAEHNPIENPHLYKADTLKVLYLITKLAPQIQDGTVLFVPEPHTLTRELFDEHLRELKEGYDGPFPEDEFLSEEPRRAKMQMRFYGRVPLDRFKSWATEEFPDKSEKQIIRMYKDIRSFLERDPISLTEYIKNDHTELQLFRSGATRNMALYMAKRMGAFPFTYSRFKHNYIAETFESLTPNLANWSNLSACFSQVELKFLNNVDAKQVRVFREEGRLSNFRSFLRTTWANVANNNTVSDSQIRDLQDELIVSLEQAQSDWAAIDRSILNNVLKNAPVPTGLASLVTGRLDLAIGSGIVLAGSTALLQAKSERQKFRTYNPMSVLIDLKKS